MTETGNHFSRKDKIYFEIYHRAIVKTGVDT